MTSLREMAPDRLAELRRVGLSWRSSGQASLHGPLLRLAESLDRAFRLLATAGWDAEEERHPASLPAELLQRVHYLHSFPHQATFPVRLQPDEANLDEFRRGPVVDPDGHLVLTQLAPTRDVLTPAACHHLYAQHESSALDAPLYLTTRNTCFRNEPYYEPLRRQWSFTMREIVCLGSRSEAIGFLDRGRSTVDTLLKHLGLDVDWCVATDPFFRPLESPQYLMQRLEPTKHEAVYGGDLAIGSANLHHEHFGENYSISRAGEPAHSACLAFGIERWLFAVVDRYGVQPESWPDPASTMQQMVSATGGQWR